MISALACLPLLVPALCAPPASAAPAGDLADTYVDAVEKTNRDHARKPRDTREEQLELPSKASRALERLLEADLDDDVAEALTRTAEAALDLARVGDFERARDRLASHDEGAAAQLGCALARPRFLLRGRDGVPQAYLETFAEVLEAVLDAYDELFGFDEWSKVPGKKLRVRVHRVDAIERPPHFAPQFAWHSEIDFPVVDVERFASPTADGKFLFYGLCHELGHVIAMWGDRTNEEDHHAWAHYTGVAVVEHLAGKRAPDCLEGARDVRWRSLDGERERLAGTAPGTDDRDSVLALFLALHDEVGPAAIGAAIDHLDALDRRLRVNRVRYYCFRELREGLLEVVKKKSQRRRVSELLD